MPEKLPPLSFFAALDLVQTAAPRASLIYAKILLVVLRRREITRPDLSRLLTGDRDNTAVQTACDLLARLQLVEQIRAADGRTWIVRAIEGRGDR